MNRTAVLAIATGIVAIGAIVVFLRDIRIGVRDTGTWRGVTSDGSKRIPDLAKVIAEAALPLIGVGALVWWAWALL
jgi:hypothetical protein